jgi:DNA helicase-2/ATP-dependent DNA helicase PcrA
VKVMTIHQAKGLEFDTVFVPGLAEGILPDLNIQHNPVERGKSLDFELRGDRDILPSFERLHRVLSKFKEALKEQEGIEERRTLYVALTRARRRLLVTGAHWYGDEVQKPKKPSAFFEELATWGRDSGLAEVDEGPELSEDNPLTGYRERFVRDWPGPAKPEDEDALFPDGWRGAAAEAASSGGPDPAAIAALTPEGQQAFQLGATRLQTLAAHLLEREREAPAPPRLPSTIAVGGVIEYARCPKRFYWTAVQPLPRFSGPAARMGTQVHRWIERQASGQASLLELDEAPDLTAEDLAGEPGKVERLQEAFLGSRFAGVTPLYAERPFLLHLDGFVVGGRIDAVFGAPDGPWEIVDYKTGRKPDAEDELAGLQLDLYALACSEVWGKRQEDLSLTYFYLASNEEVSRPAGTAGGTRDRVLAALRGMVANRFDPTPGPQCRWCDFLPFCDAGTRFMGGQSSG